MPELSFDVTGLPAPQGSKTAVSAGGRARVIEGGSATGRKAHAAWRAAVHQACSDAITADLEAPWDAPVAVTVTFRFPMPASRNRATRLRGWAWKQSKPDLDKLLRSTCDSLTTAGLLADDSRIVRAVAEKVELDGSWTGAEIHVTTAVGEWS